MRDIVVIGASAGGVQALMEIVQGFPTGLSAAVFVVIHTSSTSPGVLPNILSRAGPIRASQARNGEPIMRSRIYVPPVDHHLLIRDGHVVVSRGPKENGFRPAVDPLFRTAAIAYRERVVGVILSGGLDDGTSGLLEVKRYGGVAIVQDPAEAVSPSMPQSAVSNVDVDHVVTLAQIPALIAELTGQRAGKGARIMPPRRRNVPDIAEVGTENLEVPDPADPPSALTCPECGGALWEVQDHHVLRFRCHLGHGYTGEALSEQQVENIENAMWVAMRTLEESAALRRNLAQRTRGSSMNLLASGYEQQARAAEQRAALIRSVLMEDKLPRVIKPLRPSSKARERAGDKPATRPNASPARVKASRHSSPAAKSNGQKRSKSLKRKGE
jgi:two-component system, chemotaxis family, protein-glutamate methylesterase/glutaminase